MRHRRFAALLVALLTIVGLAGATPAHAAPNDRTVTVHVRRSGDLPPGGLFSGVAVCPVGNPQCFGTPAERDYVGNAAGDVTFTVDSTSAYSLVGFVGRPGNVIDTSVAVQLPADTAPDERQIVVPLTRGVLAHVTDVDGNPLPARIAGIGACPDPGTGPACPGLRAGFANASGDVALRLDVELDYTITAFALRSTLVLGADHVPVDAGTDPVTGLSFTLPEARISGTATWPEVSPIPADSGGVAACPAPEAGSECPDLHLAYVDEDGSYSLDLGPGAWNVYGFTVVDDVITHVPWQSVTLGQAEWLVVDGALATDGGEEEPTTRTVSARVVDDDGEPQVAGEPGLAACPTPGFGADCPGRIEAPTDENGEASLTLAADVEYDVAAFAYSASTPVEPFPRWITVPPGDEDVTDLEFTFPKAQVFGTLTWPGHETFAPQAAGVRACAVPVTVPSCSERVTYVNADGTYSLLLLPGTWNIEGFVHAGGTMLGFPWETVTVDQAEAIPVSGTVEPHVVVAHPLDADGHPFPPGVTSVLACEMPVNADCRGAVVSMDDEGDGTVELALLPDREYRVQELVFPQEYATGGQVFSSFLFVGPEDDGPYTFTVPHQTISGTLTWPGHAPIPTGTPVAGVGVCRAPETGPTCPSLRYVLAAPDGSYSLTLPPGDWNFAPFVMTDGNVYVEGQTPGQARLRSTPVALDLTVHASLIDVTVLDADGQPFPPQVGAVVACKIAFPCALADTTVGNDLDGDGHFTLALDSRVSYRLTGMAYGNELASGGAVFSTSTVGVTAASHPASVSLSLPPARLYGGVIRFGVSPIPAGTTGVSACRAPSTQWSACVEPHSTFAQPNGSYDLVLPPGTWNIASFTITNGVTRYGDRDQLVLGQARRVQQTRYADPWPEVSIVDATVAESTDGSPVEATFVVKVSAPSTQLTIVDWTTVDGTARSPGDFSAASGTLVLAPGELSRTITVTVDDDELAEPSERFTVVLSNPQRSTIKDGSANGTITDADALPVVSVDDATRLEGNANGAATVRIRLSRPSGYPTKVTLATAADSASAGTDFTTKTAAVTIPAGATEGSFLVTVIGDRAHELDEAFTVDVTATTSSTVDDGSATVTIVDDDPQPSAKVADVTVVEGSSGVVRVTLSAASFETVTYAWSTADDTAASGDHDAMSGTVTFLPGDTVEDIAVPTTLDSVFELKERFFVNLSDPSNGSILDGQASVFITDDDPQPMVTVDALSKAEGGAPNTFAVTVRLSQVAEAPVSVPYATADGTAIAGADYVAKSGVVKVLAGQLTATIPISVIGDAVREPEESFVVNVSGTSTAQGVVTIANDDAPPALKIADVTTDEGSTRAVRVTLSAATFETVTVDWATADDTAKAGDHTAASGTITFLPGQTSRDVTVMTTPDSIFELKERFFVNLSNPANATIADAQAAVYILDDDAAPSVTVDALTKVEGSRSNVFTITLRLSEVSEAPVTVSYATADGSAIAGFDYVAKSGSVRFNAGQTTVTIAVSVTGDAVVEPDESFLVNLSGHPSGQGVITVVNDD